MQEQMLFAWRCELLKEVVWGNFKAQSPVGRTLAELEVVLAREIFDKSGGWHDPRRVNA